MREKGLGIYYFIVFVTLIALVVLCGQQKFSDCYFGL